MKSSQNKNIHILPQIKRVREYRAYTFKGKRLLDFFLCDGTALLGHKQAIWSQRFKDSFQKHALAAYPHPAQQRLPRVLKDIFPNYAYFYFLSYGDVLQLPSVDFQAIPVLRPFESTKRFENLVQVVIPAPGFRHYACLASEEAVLTCHNLLLPVPLLTAAVRLLSRWTDFSEQYTEFWWQQWEHPLFDRSGPYLRYKENFDQYYKVFHEFLEAGVLLNPDPCEPSIIPANASDGERKCFLKTGV